MDDLKDQDDCIRIPVHFEFYLRHRAEPLQVAAIHPVERSEFEMLDDDRDLARFVDMCIQSVLGVLDIRGEERYVLTDQRQNKFVILRDDVQAISVLAPDASTIQQLLIIAAE